MIDNEHHLRAAPVSYFTEELISIKGRFFFSYFYRAQEDLQ